MSKLVFREVEGRWVVGLVNNGRIYCQYRETFDTAPEAAAKMRELEGEWTV